MADVHQSWFSSEACSRFHQMHADIFKVEAQAKALGMEGVKQALYEARIALGNAEERERREFTARREAEEAAAVGVSLADVETPCTGKTKP